MTYFAYPGWRKWLLVSPTITPVLLGVVYIHQYGFYGPHNKLFAVAMIFLHPIAILALGVLGAIGHRTRIDILSDELVYYGVKITLSPPRLFHVRTPIKWKNIVRIEQKTAPRRGVVIYDSKGAAIHFSVLWSSSINKRLFSDISSRLESRST